MRHFLLRNLRTLSRYRFVLRPLILVVFILVLTFITLKSISFAKHLGLSSNSLINTTKDPRNILQSTDNRTNFLLLGMRGSGDDSPDLTDTMIIVSYNFDTGKTTLISVPRDLWVPSLKTKINAVYHYGELKQSGGGITLAKSSIEELLGLPVHYAIIVNFQAFTQIIDALGGVDINVATAFTDKLFPIPGKENAYPESSRYETVSFVAGPQHMDGATALKFVRSRHAEGDEGTDFARSRRQELLIRALEQKVLTSDFLLNKDKLDQISKLITSNISTDIPTDSFPTIAKLAFSQRNTPLNTINLSSEKVASEPAILVSPKPALYDNQWVLVPQDGNYKALQQYISNKLTGRQ